MDQYVTTYNKDYTWPPAHKGPMRIPDASQKTIQCYCDKDAKKKLRLPKKQDPDSQDWSRIGPMGRLLDPKLYPAKTGPFPENDSTRFNQPDAYLKKVEEKYPNVYGVIKATPMTELITRVDADRLKTTYQVDYADTTQLYGEDCARAEPPVEAECGSNKLPSQKRGRKSKSDEKNGQRKRRKGNKKGDEPDSGETRVPPWRTEYQDGINKIGQAIIRGKIHQTRKNVAPAWMMSF